MTNIKELLAGVIGAVEANSFEHMTLWKENTERKTGPRDWKDTGFGHLVCVGYVADDPNMPIWMSLTTSMIDGHKILFYDVTSRFVDHDLVEDWLKKNLPITAFRNNDPREYPNKTNAMNFHVVFPHKVAA